MNAKPIVSTTDSDVAREFCKRLNLFDGQSFPIESVNQLKKSERVVADEAAIGALDGFEILHEQTRLLKRQANSVSVGGSLRRHHAKVIVTHLTR